MILAYTFFSRTVTAGKTLIVLIVLLTVLLYDSTPVFAQVLPMYEQQSIVDTFPKKWIPRERPRAQNFKRATGQLLLVEVLPWTFDKYIKKADYADISFKSTVHNLNPGNWGWDKDPFQTNQFGHPYHGSLYFNAFRTNGYSFWQSVPAAFAGSYLWETFGEKETPAINDFVNTSFGGIVLGEMTYRLSNMIVNNRGRGFSRQVSEVLAFVVNPQNGFNRLLSGKWGKLSRNTVERDSSKISAEFDLGARRYNADNLGLFGWYGHVKLLYGTPYQEYRVPFSNISINVEFGKDDSASINVISVYGSLAGWKIRSNKNINHLAVLSANYDYLHNQAFFFGGQSVKINLLSEFTLPKKIKINTNIGAGPILLAAVPDAYLFNGRNYDYGPGFAINGGGKISISDKISYSLNYRGGWMRTVNGNQSHYFLHTVSNELNVKLIDDFAISAESGYFTLQGNYNTHPDVTKNYPYVRVSARYTVNL